MIPSVFMDAGESYLLSLLSFPFICSNYHRCWWDATSLNIVDQKSTVPAAIWRNYYCRRPAGGLRDAQFAFCRQPFCFGQVKYAIKWPLPCRCVHVRVRAFSRKDKLIRWHWYYSDWLLFPLWLLSKPTIEGWNGDNSRPDEAASLR